MQMQRRDIAFEKSRKWSVCVCVYVWGGKVKQNTRSSTENPLYIIPQCTDVVNSE